VVVGGSDLATEGCGEAKSRIVFVVTCRPFNAKGDGVADDTSAIQAAVDAAPRGSAILFPSGTYKVTAPLILDNKDLVLQGVATVSGGATPGSGSVIIGRVDGPILRSVNKGGSSRFHVDLLFVRNTHPSGTAIHVQGVTIASIERSEVSGFIGIMLRKSTFTVLIRSVKIHGSLRRFPAGSIGLYAGGHAHVEACDITGWEEGIRASGTTVNMIGNRIEVNRTGLRLGVNAEGSPWLLARSIIAGNSLEANDTAIEIRSLAHSVLEGMGLHGSTNAPSGQSSYAVNITGGVADTLFAGLSTFGRHNKAGIAASPGARLRRVTFANVNAVSGIPGVPDWDIRTSIQPGGVAFYQTNYSVRGDGVTTGDINGAYAIRALSGYDPMNGFRPGKNLRRIGEGVAKGATSLKVAFSDEKSSRDAGIRAATPTTGGSLAVGTYYYVATVVTENGETEPAGEKTVAVAAPRNAVAITFSPVEGTPRWKRRVYRGTESGGYRGYYETPVGFSGTFIDSGRTFDGIKSPPSPGEDESTSGIEPDASYGVWVAPSWNTSWWVGGKETTGFTINFGTPAPAGARVDWLIVR
jgi:hypothetical protein